MEKFAQTLKSEFPNQVRYYSGEAASLDKILKDASVPPQPRKPMVLPGYNSVKVLGQ
jgi:hypothetical protein